MLLDFAFSLLGAMPLYGHCGSCGRDRPHEGDESGREAVDRGYLLKLLFIHNITFYSHALYPQFRYATGTFPFGGDSQPFIYLNNICFYTENRIFRIHRAIAFPVCLLWAEGKWESQKPVSNRIHVLLDTGFIKYLFI